ncbi:MAG: UvrD-helicase domain-containing protein, partial [Lachnoanaerobaculum saburreum]
MELINYSSNQKKAIEHGDGPLMVLAGPGSGKTFVITHRIKYLIKGPGINPAHILVVTFSRAAAKEMKDRFEKLYSKSPVTFGTFHSVFFSLLKTAYGFGSEQIASDELRYTLIKELIK